jgi:hypothetical protein
MVTDKEDWSERTAEWIRDAAELDADVRHLLRPPAADPRLRRRSRLQPGRPRGWHHARGNAGLLPPG